jgi:hypothetical protein
VLAWVAWLIVGYGLLLHALGWQLRPEPDNVGTALCFAGVSLLASGFGDIVATEAPACLVTLIAAANGLGLFALVIMTLFTLYGSFQRRESAVVVLKAGAWGASETSVTAPLPRAVNLSLPRARATRGVTRRHPLTEW